MEEIKNIAKKLMKNSEKAHDFSHVLRVYNLCNIASRYEKVDEEVLKISALLHDIARYDELRGAIKNHAKEGAEMARKILQSLKYPQEKIRHIVSCIRTHRWSEGLKPKTKEALILKEADRIDSIGAIGILRTTAFNHNKEFYHKEDPFGKKRILNDKKYALDHFFVKLLKIKDTIKTPYLRNIAENKHQYMVVYLNNLKKEIEIKKEGPTHKLSFIIRENHSLNFEDMIDKIKEYKHYKIIDDFLKQVEYENFNYDL